MPVDESLAQALRTELTPLAWEDRLRALGHRARLRMAFSTSFGLEDQAILHVIAREQLKARIFTLDTGRLFEATHDVHQRTREKYGLAIETFFPDAAAVESYVKQHGINGFYDNVGNRLSCCHIRKVEPLARALRATDVWISGVRNEHSSARSELPVAEWDAARRMVKIYPLIEITQEALVAFIKSNAIPYNTLHDQGYPSIGCAPCTRAVEPKEPSRAGRWWWEQESDQECGLHLKDGRLVPVAKHKGEAHA